MSIATACAAALVWLAVGCAVPGSAGLSRGGADRRPTRLPHRPVALPRRTHLLAAVAAAAGTCLLLPGLWGVATALVAGVLVALLLPLAARRAEARARRDEDLPETLDLLAAALEAGAALRTAVQEVAAVCDGRSAQVLGEVSARVAVGISDADAWRAQTDDPAWGAVARDLARSSDTGSAAAKVLRRHAADARTTRRDEQVARARTMGVRSVVPLMVCFLPAFLLTGVVPVVASLATSLAQR